MKITFSDRFDHLEHRWPSRSRAAFAALLILVTAGAPISARAQEEQGPSAPLPPAQDSPASLSVPGRPKAPSAPRSPSANPPQTAANPSPDSEIKHEQPAIPVDQIVQRFAAREEEFKEERDNFTYTQTFVVQTLDASNRPDGEYRLTSDITFTPDGKRYENVTFAPESTLERIMLSQEDMDDLKNVQPFVLTTQDLPKYDTTYVGRQQVDEIGTYVFDVAPKKIEKNQRYFQGRIWVDDRDMEIVKTYGKAVPDVRKGSNENVFPRFETYRENIEGNYWFPTYTHADDVLHFRSGDVHIRMIVRYTDYKRFRVSTRILPAPPETSNQH